MNIIFASSLILSGGQVFLGLAAIAGSIYCGILAYKLHLNNKSEALKNEIVGEHISDNNSPLLRKYEAVDIHQHGKSIQLVGTITALVIVLVVFAWTEASRPSEGNSGLADAVDLEMPIDPPVTVAIVALPPPPATLPLCGAIEEGLENLKEAKKESLM